MDSDTRYELNELRDSLNELEKDLFEAMNANYRGVTDRLATVEKISHEASGPLRDVKNVLSNITAFQGHNDAMLGQFEKAVDRCEVSLDSWKQDILILTDRANRIEDRLTKLETLTSEIDDILKLTSEDVDRALSKISKIERDIPGWQVDDR